MEPQADLDHFEEETNPLPAGQRRRCGHASATSGGFRCAKGFLEWLSLLGSLEVRCWSVIFHLNL